MAKYQEAADCVLSHLLHRLNQYPSAELGPTQIDSALHEEFDVPYGSSPTTSQGGADAAPSSSSGSAPSSALVPAASASSSATPNPDAAPIDSWHRLHLVVDGWLLLTLMQRPSNDPKLRTLIALQILSF